MKKENKKVPEGRLVGWGSALLRVAEEGLVESKTEADPAVREWSWQPMQSPRGTHEKGGVLLKAWKIDLDRSETISKQHYSQ